jgi:hypothetical protein
MSSRSVEQSSDGRGAVTGRERKRAASRRWRQRQKVSGNCTSCGKPRGEDGSKLTCSSCVKRLHERRQRWIKAGHCENCGKPRGTGGTDTLCHDCADKYKARYRERVDEGLCVLCRGPRGADGTKNLCRHCADEQSAEARTRRVQRIKQGVCPKHKTEMDTLEHCPVCLFEAPDGQLSDLSFDGLIPRPESGDDLAACVLCDGCGRIHHEGSSYYKVPLPKDAKLKDLHLGEGGKGVWLRPSDVDGDGRILVEYEVCSTPEKKCTDRLSKNTVFQYIQRNRAGKKKLGICFSHARRPGALTEIFDARARLHSGAPSQAQNGNRQENVGSNKGQHGGARNVKWTAQKKAEFLALYEKELPKIQRRDASLPDDVRAQLNLRDNAPHEVALDYVARLMGVEPKEYLRTVLKEARKARIS